MMEAREAIEIIDIWHQGMRLNPIEVDEAINMAIKALERQIWIPVSARLPEKPMYDEDSYIVQTNDIITPFSAYWDGENWSDSESYPVEGVIAWMPLPEPYKGE